MSRLLNSPGRILLPALLVLAAWSISGAQGGSAIITLVMPPPGGDGYSALQSGGAFPTGAASLYYNPALLSGLQDATNSQFHFTRSHQGLLPSLGLEDMDQDFWGVALALPDPKDKFDVGLGFFRNHVDFGENLTPTGSEEEGDTFSAGETVYGFGGSVRLASPVHLGGTIKYYDSRLGEDATATGWAFDVGLAVVAPPDLVRIPGAASFTVVPSAGVALQNVGPDAWYDDPEARDPLPTQVRTSLGLRVDFADIIGASLGADWERDVNRRARPEDRATRVTGGTLQLFVFQIGSGRLLDRTGQRDERNNFQAIDLNALQLYRLFARVDAGDFSSRSEAFDTGFPIAKISVFGIPYRANPRLLIGRRKISSDGNGIREGQRAWYFSLSI